MDIPIILLRNIKNEPLSWEELDNNFSQLKNSLLQLQNELNNLNNSEFNLQEFQQLQTNLAQVQAQFNDLQTSFDNLPDFSYIESQLNTLTYEISNMSNGNASPLYPIQKGNALFHGGASNFALTQNITTIFTQSLELAQLENYIDSQYTQHGGAGMSHSSFLSFWVYSKYRLLSNTGTVLLDQNTTTITDRYELAGTPIDSNSGMLYGGRESGDAQTNRLSIFTADTGESLQAETFVGIGQSYNSSAKVVDSHIYFGTKDYFTYEDNILLLNNNGDLVLNENHAATQRNYSAGCGLDSVALFYGGTNRNNSLVFNNLVLVNSAGTVIQNLTSVGTGRQGSAGAKILSNAFFYGGRVSYQSDEINYCINNGVLISPAGDIIKQEVNIGVPRTGLSGGGF